MLNVKITGRSLLFSLCYIVKATTFRVGSTVDIQELGYISSSIPPIPQSLPTGEFPTFTPNHDLGMRVSILNREVRGGEPRH